MKLLPVALSLTCTFSYHTAHPKLVLKYLLGRQACNSAGYSTVKGRWSYRAAFEQVYEILEATCIAQVAQRLLAKWPKILQSFTHHNTPPFKVIQELQHSLSSHHSCSIFNWCAVLYTVICGKIHTYNIYLNCRKK